MSKYQPLADFLKDFRGAEWNATFADIERVLGFRLPPSAHEHRAWWANQFKGHHSQAKGWIEAGWVTREIDQRRGLVRFERRSRQGASDTDALWRQAERMTGVRDRAELEKLAVNALIHREAGRALAALGGTMPDLAVPQRERPA
jgi:hypothetical protein